MNSSYSVRPAVATELAQLPLIERAASVRFAQTRYAALSGDTPSVDEAYLRQQQAQGLVWVAVDSQDQPIGFIVADVLDGAIYIHEVDVLPEHGQRGLGRRLVSTVCQWARTAGYPAVALATFRDVPWNAPFYARLGFQEIAEDELTPGLLDLRQKETEAGLAATDRVLMRLDLLADGQPDSATFGG